MNLNITTEDPLNILTSTKSVLQKSRFVTINESGIDELAKKVKIQLDKGLESAEEGFCATGNYMKDVQLIFLQSVVNFCFWAEKDKPKWQVEWPKGTSMSGAYGMIASFKRALVENPNVLNADYLISLSKKDVENLFRSNNGTEIPLLDKRLENLKEAGDVLKKKYDGEFINALEEADFDAIKIAKILVKDFPSFNDKAIVEGNEVFFFKRAQICPNDLSYLSKGAPKSITNLKSLSAFADYKIPQILKEAGIISYMSNLEKKIESYELIPSGSREEIEIRAATIWGVELLRQKMNKYTAAEVDNAIWLISQDQTGVHPYHRTYTIYY
jgi:hypothetical protein